MVKEIGELSARVSDGLLDPHELASWVKKIVGLRGSCVG
jgi:hypothetical protein